MGSFLKQLKPLDAKRLQKSVKATVQLSGRLTFAMDAVNEMNLSEDKSIIILEAGDGNLGAVLSHKGDENAFTLKKCGLYFYVSFKNYLQQAGVDYKNKRVIYDITELDEKYEGKTLYKFERRILARGAKDDEDIVEIDSDEQEPPSKPSEAAKPTDTRPNAEECVESPESPATSDSANTEGEN